MCLCTALKTSAQANFRLLRQAVALRGQGGQSEMEEYSDSGDVSTFAQKKMAAICFPMQFFEWPISHERRAHCHCQRTIRMTTENTKSQPLPAHDSNDYGENKIASWNDADGDRSLQNERCLQNDTHTSMEITNSSLQWVANQGFSAVLFSDCVSSVHHASSATRNDQWSAIDPAPAGSRTHWLRAWGEAFIHWRVNNQCCKKMKGSIQCGIQWWDCELQNCNGSTRPAKVRANGDSKLPSVSVANARLGGFAASIISLTD